MEGGGGHESTNELALCGRSEEISNNKATKAEGGWIMDVNVIRKQVGWLGPIHVLSPYTYLKCCLLPYVPNLIF